MGTPSSKPSGTHKLRGVIAGVFVVLAAVAIVAWTTRNVEKERRTEQLAEARLVARAVNAERVRKLSGTESDLNSPDYLRIIEQLSQVHGARSELLAVYLLGKRSDGAVFYFAHSDPTAFPPGKACPDCPEALQQTFARGVESTASFRGNSTETEVCAFVPIYGSKSREILAVLGMLEDQQSLKGDVARRCIVPFALLLACAILFTARTARQQMRQGVPPPSINDGIAHDEHHPTAATLEAQVQVEADYRASQEIVVRLSALKERLLVTMGLSEKLKLITDTIVSVFDADFSRIWMIGEGDLCESGCAHAGATEGPHVCVNRERCLHLMASSGRYTHMDGPHQRVPIGCYKIGRIASGDEAQFITNDVVHDPHVHNPKWAEELGLISFAGWRLLSRTGTPIGVLILFSKHPISAVQANFLDDLSNTTSQIILTGFATEALYASERKLLSILQGCPIPQYVIDRDHRVISWNKPMEKYSRISQEEIIGTCDHWRAFYSQARPCLGDLLVDGTPELIPQWYGDKCKPAPLLEEAYVGTAFFPDLGSIGTWLHFTAALIRDGQGQVIGAVETFEDITERKNAEMELQKSRNELEMRVDERTRDLTRANASMFYEVERRRETEESLRKAHGEVERLLASMSSFLIGLDRDSCVSRWNVAAESTFGLSLRDAAGKRIDECGMRWDTSPILEQLASMPSTEETVRLLDVPYTRTDGTPGFLGVTIDPIKSVAGAYEGCFLLGTDTTERRNLETQLVQAQKLESVGQLAAGIAHEINTPTQYVGDNIEFLMVAYDSLANVAQVFSEMVDSGRSGSFSPELLAKAQTLVEGTDLEYLCQQIPQAIGQSLEGVGIIAGIVQSMKEFSHPGSSEKTTVDLNQCIRSTTTVSRNEWKYVADLDLDLDETLPPVLCLPGEFNQAVLNMVVNASHAIGDVVGDGTDRKGIIHISTRHDGKWAELRISDTGTGIPDAIRERIFDPFFTTKEVGRGTGQGLAIVRNVVVDKHAGTLHIDTEVGKGTTFIIRLPIHGEASASGASSPKYSKD